MRLRFAFGLLSVHGPGCAPTVWRGGEAGDLNEGDRLTSEEAEANDDARQAGFFLDAIESHVALQEVIGDWLPLAQTERLNEIVEHWRDPIGPALGRLAPHGGAQRDWLAVLRGGSQSVRDGMTACHYHVSRIEQIENEVISFCERREDLFPEGRDTSFRIPSLSAEYAALQFALRRTLDYAAIAISAFFKTDGGSFRRLDRTVDGREPTECSDAIKCRLAEQDLSGVRGTEDGHSVRDQLAHHRAVELAWFGVQRVRGELKIRYASEVEDIVNDDFLTTPHRGRDLSQAVKEKLSLVEEIIFGCYADLGLLSQ
ncbi:MAG TPA: hypothetical protein VLK89_09415 [Solirubrobacterales bacterium]|nr:hypothetical protein [Solirubrobacterales bacterium]